MICYTKSLQSKIDPHDTIQLIATRSLGRNSFPITMFSNRVTFTQIRETFISGKHIRYAHDILLVYMFQITLLLSLLASYMYIRSPDAHGVITWYVNMCNPITVTSVPPTWCPVPFPVSCCHHTRERWSVVGDPCSPPCNIAHPATHHWLPNTTLITHNAPLIASCPVTWHQNPPRFARDLEISPFQDLIIADWDAGHVRVARVMGTGTPGRK